MLTVRVIPCLDVRDGRVVKGIRFQDLADQGSPVERARTYQEEGADELVILDVAATPEGRLAQLDTVKRVREVLSVPLTVGGGLRGEEDAAHLLAAGADKVSVNSAAVEDPSLLDTLAGRYGSQCTVVAIDAASCPADGSRPSGFEVVVRSGTRRTGLDAVAWAQEAAGRGAGEILLTSFDRDGTRAGYDLPLLEAVRRRVGVPIIASGGADTPEHMVEAVAAGADAVLAASIFHQADWTVGDLKTRLGELGLEVRT